MATKAQIQTQVNTINNGGLNTAAEVRDVFATNQASLLEGIYADAVTDNETSETITTSTALFDYDIVVSKVGRFVTISGNFISNSNLVANTSIFQFSNAEYNADTTAVYGIATSSNGSIPIYMSAAHLRVARSVVNGEIFQFSITYPVKD
jgi:hypothetical protein